MSDPGYIDEGFVHDGTAEETWDDVYPYQDEDGLRYTEEDARALIAGGEYYVEDEESITADTPIAEFGGASLRQMWDTLPANERAEAREAYAVEKYRQLKEQNG
jgi:hypothetical protein